VTTEPEHPKRVPEPETVATPAAPPPWRGPAWVHRLPGPIGVWLAAVALVAACLIGCGGFALGAVVSHGFRDGGYSREDRGGHHRRYGDERRGEEKTPTPSTSVSPKSASPSPSVSPTA
jgi:hypothetical protein